MKAKGAQDETKEQERQGDRNLLSRELEKMTQKRNVKKGGSVEDPVDTGDQEG